MHTSDGNTPQLAMNLFPQQNACGSRRGIVGLDIQWPNQCKVIVTEETVKSR